MGGRGDQVGGQDRQGGEDEEEKEVEMWEMQEDLDKGWVISRVGTQVEKSSNLHITRDSTGSTHKNVRGKKV